MDIVQVLTLAVATAVARLARSSECRLADVRKATLRATVAGPLPDEERVGSRSQIDRSCC